MNVTAFPRFTSRTLQNVAAMICIFALLPGDTSLFGMQAAGMNDAGPEQSVKIPADQLDSLVAPIALYPDQLLTQTLVASTYPLEIVQLQQWLEKNKNLKDKALVEAAKKQDWDPSIQALVAFPEVAKSLAENIKWTTDLGNAFLAQQIDIMDAVQRMRNKAQHKGNLKSTEQQKVETKVVENKQVVVIQQASPEVVYVPSYNPTVVYGVPAYPYPPVTYPPPGYFAAGMAISFGVGVAMGAAWGGGWGWGCGWGHNDVYVNNNNNFVRNSNQNINRNTNRTTNRGNSGTSGWQHNPQHRGGAPYGDRATAKQYGGTSRGDSLANRQENARRNQGERSVRQQAGANVRINNRPQGGVGNRGSVGNMQQASNREGGVGGRQPTVSNRTAGTRDASNLGAGVSDRSAQRGGGDRVGDRSVPSGGGFRGSSAFGGGGGGFNGSSARSSSARGSSSFGGGGGRRAGGGGRRR